MWGSRFMYMSSDARRENEGSTFKTHDQAAIPPIPSIFSISNANSPPNAPLKEANVKNTPIRNCNSSFLYIVERYRICIEKLKEWTIICWKIPQCKIDILFRVTSHPRIFLYTNGGPSGSHISTSRWHSIISHTQEQSHCNQGCKRFHEGRKDSNDSW